MLTPADLQGLRQPLREIAEELGEHTVRGREAQELQAQIANTAPGDGEAPLKKAIEIFFDLQEQSDEQSTD